MRLFNVWLAATLLAEAPLHAGAQKQVYIPEDLRGMDLENDTSQWSWRRPLRSRFLVVMAAPATHRPLAMPHGPKELAGAGAARQYPYIFNVN